MSDELKSRDYLPNGIKLYTLITNREFQEELEKQYDIYESKN